MHRMFLATIFAALLGACIEAESTNHAALTASDGVKPDSVRYNSLTADNTTAASLAANPLTSSALNANPLTAAALTSTASTPRGLTEGEENRLILQYLYGCAMAAGTSTQLVINNVNYGTLDGAVGLAPQWASGACDQSCQRWVSACVLARSNYIGATTSISLRGSNAAISSPSGNELSAYPLREGAFFGNLFA